MNSSKWVTVCLLSAITLCVGTGLAFLVASDMPIALAAEGSNLSTISVSYTPTYSTQYAISVPSNLALGADGSATSITIAVSSWSDFPTDKSLYCDLSTVGSLTSGGNSVDMVVKNGEDVVVAGDRIATFTPTSLASSDSAHFAVITVEPAEKPAVSGTYSGTIGVEVGLVE